MVPKLTASCLTSTQLINTFPPIICVGHFRIHEFYPPPIPIIFANISCRAYYWSDKKNLKHMIYSYSIGLHFLFYENFCQMKGFEDMDN